MAIPNNRQKTGGLLRAVGAAASLLLKIVPSFFGPPAELGLTYSVIFFTFGAWLASPVSGFGFHPILLMWIPWSAVVISFLLWTSAKVLRHQCTQVFYIALTVFGLWILVALVVNKVFSGFTYLEREFPWGVIQFSNDLFSMVMVVGIGLVVSTSAIREVESSPQKEATHMTQTNSSGLLKWGSRIAYGYVVMLAIAIALGFVAGDMINKGGILAGDSVAIVSWFILFPAYILADAIVNARFLTCPLRAAFLPLLEGFVIFQVTDWGDPFGVSQTVAIIYFMASVVVVAIARSVRRRKALQWHAADGGTRQR